MAKHTDYAFKSYVLKEHGDLVQKQKKCSLNDYAIKQLNDNGVLMPFLSRSNNELMTSNDLFIYCVENGLHREYNEILKINHASYERTKRLKERIEVMLLKGACLFLTLTFNDNTLASTTEKERRTAVTRFLKAQCSQYVANIDYGSKNHREHYHAVVCSDSIVFDTWRKFGNINAERVRMRDVKTDKTKLSKYICKLSNHAIKETTKRSSLIYSR